jgi:hypothetical protein
MCAISTATKVNNGDFRCGRQRLSRSLKEADFWNPHSVAAPPRTRDCFGHDDPKLLFQHPRMQLFDAQVNFVRHVIPLDICKCTELTTLAFVSGVWDKAAPASSSASRQLMTRCGQTVDFAAIQSTLVTQHI